MKKLRYIIIGFIGAAYITASPLSAFADSQPSSKISEEIKELSEILQRDSSNVEALTKLTRIYSYQRNSEQMLLLTDRLQALCEESDDLESLLFCIVSKGVAYQGLGQADSMTHYYTRGLELGKELDSAWAMVTIYNGMGVYTVEVEMDYYKGMSYFMKGMEFTSGDNDPNTYPLLCNIAATYYLRNDPAGLDYALEAYELGHKFQQEYMIYVGANVLAGMYYLLGDYPQSLKFIKETEALVDTYGDHTGVYSLYGNILLALGDEEGAVSYYLKSLEYADQGTPVYVTGAYLNYADYLISIRDFESAVNYLDKGLTLSLTSGKTVNRYKLYRSLSRCYEEIGNPDYALDYYKNFHEESDSIFNAIKERSLDELRVKYETEKHQRLIHEKQVELLREAKKSQIIMFILIIILFALAAIYTLYRRQSKMYKKIVRRQQDFVNMEKRLKTLSDAPDNKPMDKYSVSSLSGEKGRNMFFELERVMQFDQVYRDKDLTIEKLAERLSTNRTYLSQIINEYANASFSNYVNSYRINEAVRVLSDPHDDTQLKVLAYDLGFNYRETFYKSFQKAIGMSPSKYREEVSKMHKDDSF